MDSKQGYQRGGEVLYINGGTFWDIDSFRRSDEEDEYYEDDELAQHEEDEQREYYELAQHEDELQIGGMPLSEFIEENKFVERYYFDNDGL